MMFVSSCLWVASVHLRQDQSVQSEVNHSSTSDDLLHDSIPFDLERRTDTRSLQNMSIHKNIHIIGKKESISILPERLLTWLASACVWVCRSPSGETAPLCSRLLTDTRRSEVVLRSQTLHQCIRQTWSDTTAGDDEVTLY